MVRRDATLIDGIGVSPIATVVSDPRLPDNPIIAANPAFCALTGYREAEITGRNCRFLTGPLTEMAASELLRDAICKRRPVLADILNYRADGSPFRNGVMVTPLFDEAGEIAWFLGSQVDLGPPEEQRLKVRTASAAERVASLPQRQREVLMLLARGWVNKQIAYHLGIAEKTVKMHRALMIERLGAATSADAIRIAVEAGL